MAASVPLVPKSIWFSLATAAKEYFDRVLNYSQACPEYKTDIELTVLRTELSASLSTKYNHSFAKDSHYPILDMILPHLNLPL
jgi:hypothetical protein